MKWILKPADDSAIEALASHLRESFRIHASQASTLGRLLVQRGIGPESADLFLSPSLAHLHSPYAMLGMKAVA